MRILQDFLIVTNSCLHPDPPRIVPQNSCLEFRDGDPPEPGHPSHHEVVAGQGPGFVEAANLDLPGKRDPERLRAVNVWKNGKKGELLGENREFSGEKFHPKPPRQEILPKKSHENPKKIPKTPQKCQKKPQKCQKTPPKILKSPKIPQKIPKIPE